LSARLSLATHFHNVAEPLIRFGMGQFEVLCIMIFFGCNAAFTTISLLDLERRNEEQHLRYFFKEITIKRMRVELPNNVACETFHPSIYLWIWASLTLGILAHMVITFWKESITASDGFMLLRDAVLWVLVTWLTSGYITTYHSIFRKHPKRI
jgi:hypothetical protein